MANLAGKPTRKGSVSARPHVFAPLISGKIIVGQNHVSVPGIQKLTSQAGSYRLNDLQWSAIGLE
jgi:hypothetical protein